MRLALAALLTVFTALPAVAMMAPEYYERAREEAPNVIVIAVHEVEGAKGDIGWCRVHGIVDEVERGTKYAVGDDVAIAVECLGPAAVDVPVGGTIWQDMPRLMKSHRGKAWLDEAGAIALSQYEVLE